MANYSIKVDLLKVKGAFSANIQGKTAKKLCLCIPIEESGLFVGQKGCYLNMTAIEMKNPQYGDTHCLKLAIDKDVYEKMTEEERNALPILGGLHAMERNQTPTTANTTVAVDADDDIPF